jgi:hypothetical protein
MITKTNLMLRTHTSFAVTLFTATFFLIAACSSRNDQHDNVLLEGTWELLSETKIEKGDTTFSVASKDQRMLKIINKSHFAFLRHDLTKGKDSTALFVAGGGSYKLEGDQYTENLEFCNAREWEDHSFQFNVEVKNDTLIQTGKEKIEALGIERIIIEKYRRV